MEPIWPKIPPAGWCGGHSSYSKPARFRPTCLFPGPSDYERVETKDTGRAGPWINQTKFYSDAESVTPEEYAERTGGLPPIPGPMPEPIPIDEQAIFGGFCGAGKTVSMGAEMDGTPVSMSEVAEMPINALREGLKQERIHDPEAFKVGDRVRVTGKAESKEGGWSLNWVTSMGEAIGKDATVRNNYGHRGFELKLDEDCCGGDYCDYPSFVLEKVDP